MFRMNDLNFSSGVAVLTPSDRPKSVRNRCVIQVLVPFLCYHFAFSHFCWHRGFCHWILSLSFSVLYRAFLSVADGLDNIFLSSNFQYICSPNQNIRGLYFEKLLLYWWQWWV